MRSEIRIEKTVFDHAADAPEQLVRRACDGPRIGRSKQRADEIVDGELHVEIGRRECRFSIGITNEVEEQTASRCPLPAKTNLRLGSKMGLQRLPRQPKGQ